MEKIFVYSPARKYIKPDITKEFAENNFSEHYSKNKFRFLSRFGKFKDKIPYFLTAFNWEHHNDVKFIERVRKLKKIEKKDLSIIIFDSHTDMYQEGEKYKKIEKEITMANWVSYILSKGYENISLIGVTDFTNSCPEREKYEYKSFGEKISFFLGEDYIQERDFKEYNGKVQLQNLEDFFNKPLKSNSFISFDSDVSSDFTDLNSQFAGRLGALKLQDSKRIIEYIKNNSKLVGFSFYGCGLGDAFTDKTEALMSLLE